MPTQEKILIKQKKGKTFLLFDRFKISRGMNDRFTVECWKGTSFISTLGEVHVSSGQVLDIVGFKGQMEIKASTA